MTVVGVLTNCYLTAWTDSQFLSFVKKFRNSDTILFIITVVWEHIMLLLKYIMQSSFPKYPKSVSEDIQREAFEKLKWRSQSMRVRNSRRSGSYPLPHSLSNAHETPAEQVNYRSPMAARSRSSDDDDEDDESLDAGTIGDRSITRRSHSSTLRRRFS